MLAVSQTGCIMSWERIHFAPSRFEIRGVRLKHDRASRDELRAALLGVLATVAGLSLGWSVWATSSGYIREGANNFNLAVAAASFFLIAVLLAIRTGSGEWPWPAVVRAVRDRPLAIVSGVLAAAGGLFLVSWLVVVAYDFYWQLHTGIAGLVLIVAALALQGRMVATFALVGACLFPLLLFFYGFNFLRE